MESFQTLLDNLGTLTKNRVRLQDSDGVEFSVLAQPTPLQQRALALLEAPLQPETAQIRLHLTRVMPMPYIQIIGGS